MTKEKYINISKVFKIIEIVWGFSYVILIVLPMIVLPIINSSIKDPNFISGLQKAVGDFHRLTISNIIVAVISLLPALVADKLRKYFNKKSLEVKDEEQTISNGALL